MCFFFLWLPRIACRRRPSMFRHVFSGSCGPACRPYRERGVQRTRPLGVKSESPFDLIGNSGAALKVKNSAIILARNACVSHFAQSVEREPASALRARLLLSEKPMKALRVFCSTFSILLRLAAGALARM